LIVNELAVFDADKTVLTGGCMIPRGNVDDVVRCVEGNNEGEKRSKFFVRVDRDWTEQKGKNEGNVSHCKIVCKRVPRYSPIIPEVAGESTRQQTENTSTVIR
jgi:hypothetical protein